MGVNFNYVRRWVERYFYWVPDWAKTALSCMAEIAVVFAFSNMLFIVEALRNDDVSMDIFSAFWQALSSSAQSGEILSLVCALVAPVVYALFIQPEKRIAWGLVFLALLAVYGLALAVQFLGDEVKRLEAIDVYVCAVLLWIVSILVNNFPPKIKGYGQIMENDANAFADMAKGVR